MIWAQNGILDSDFKNYITFTRENIRFLQVSVRIIIVIQMGFNSSIVIMIAISL